MSLDIHPQTLPWYAIRTRSNFERAASTALADRGYESYVPLYLSRRRWSDRVVTTELPLFPGYMFCRFDVRERIPIVSAPGVVSIVGFGNEPAPVPPSEIEAVQTVLRSGLASEPCPFIHEGQRVRITHGSLMDLEGILIRKKSDWRLVISVTMLQRSVAVEVEHNWIAAL